MYGQSIRDSYRSDIIWIFGQVLHASLLVGLHFGISRQPGTSVKFILS